MTVCALAIDMAAVKARSVRRANMASVDVSIPAARMKAMLVSTKSEIRKGEL
jgi:hypothetical protein